MKVLLSNKLNDRYKYLKILLRLMKDQLMDNNTLYSKHNNGMLHFFQDFK